MGRAVLQRRRRVHWCARKRVEPFRVVEALVPEWWPIWKEKFAARRRRKAAERAERRARAREEGLRCEWPDDEEGRADAARVACERQRRCRL